MDRYKRPRLRIWVLLVILLLPGRAFSQSQVGVDAAQSSRAASQKTKINIVSIEFDGENPLSDELRTRLVEEVRNSEHWADAGEPDSSWVGQALEPMRETLRGLGYFKTNLKGTSYLVLAQANERSYVLRLMIDAAPKYKLGKLTFVSATSDPLHFTHADLREQMNLQEDELFNVQKIRKGLESIGSKGYIDATSEPDTTVDEKDSRIDLLVKIDEQKPYQIAEIELLGSDATAKNKSKIPQERGDVFNMSLWRNFFEENKSHLPTSVSPNKNRRILRDITKGTVDITLDFRPAQKPSLAATASSQTCASDACPFDGASGTAP
jgi:outer membrane protein assembly factor BamA